MSHPIQTIQFQDLNAQINLAERSKKDLIEFLNVSKGKILTLIKTVFSFLNDKSLLKNESHSSFMKYTIESKLVQTMNKVYNFYTANFPENGRETLHDLIKERYLKFIKFYEQNNIFFVNSTELEYKFYLIQAMILLWLIEIKYDTEYYDEIIRVINGLVRLSQKDKNNIITNSSSKSEKNNYLLDFLNIIMKFPYIKQNKEIIIHALEVNECSETLIEVFNNNLINLIKNRNSSFHQRQTISSSEQNEDKSDINFGKKSISSSKEDSYFSLIKENKKEKEKEKTVTSSSISNKRKSFSNASSHKGILSSINSSGFYTPEFKHAKRGSIRNFRRFTINNINNPRTSISNKNNSLSRSLSTGMNNLLNKCEEGINHNNNINNLNNINNINNINNFNNINNKVQQPQNFQQPQNQNRQINDNLYVLSFPYYCQLCKIAPIYQALYYCKECKLTICPKCELSEGQKHIHPFYKIQTTQQFDFLMIENSTGIEKLLDGVSNKLEGAYNSMLGFFGTNNNNNNNRNLKNDPVNQRPQRISLIQLARNYYDLRNFTDQQIETALLKANKNIDEAVIILVSQ